MSKLDTPHVEADLFKSLKSSNPSDLHSVFSELNQLRTQEGAAAFKQDLVKINKDLEDLFKKGLLPHLQLVEDTTNPDGFKLNPLDIPPPKPAKIPETPPVKDNVNPGAAAGSDGGGSSGGGSSGGGSSGGGSAGSDSGGGSSGGGSTGGAPSGTTDAQPGSTAPTNLPDTHYDGYVNPLQGNLTPERIDMGVDYAGKGEFRAMGNSVVTNIHGGWPGGPANADYLELTLTDGPNKGQSYFVAEGINPIVKVGQQVKAGQVVAHIVGGPNGIETGWSDGHGEPLAKSTGGYSEGQRTAAGDAYSSFIHGLGAPEGKTEGRPTVGHVDPNRYSSTTSGNQTPNRRTG